MMMKVFEILRNDIKSVNEAQVITALKAFNWSYEFSENISKITKGNKELELLENQVYQFWKSYPKEAITAWNKYSYGVDDSETVPSFIFRLQAQE